MHDRRRWIFGYGSLVWRPAFPHAERRAASVRGWARRLWQGSPDHRGVRDAPGRVLTLVPRPEALCWGVAYRVEDAARGEVLATLDARGRSGSNLDYALQMAAALRDLQVDDAHVSAVAELLAET
jgi:cation transport regulator ChaC